jgi:hypothetical protein
MVDEKKYHYKLVYEEYPGGIIYPDKGAALSASDEYRSSGYKCYVRKIKMSEEEFNKLEEF